MPTEERVRAMSFAVRPRVVGRYLGHPIFGSVEIVGFLATLTAALALPYRHAEDDRAVLKRHLERLTRRQRLANDPDDDQQHRAGQRQAQTRRP